MFLWSDPGLTMTSMYGMMFFSGLFFKRRFSKQDKGLPPVFRPGAFLHRRIAAVVFLVRGW